MSMYENRTAPLVTAALVALVGLWLAPNAETATQAVAHAAIENKAKAEYQERMQQVKSEHVVALAVCDAKRGLDWNACVMKVDADYAEDAARANAALSARIHNQVNEMETVDSRVGSALHGAKAS